MYYMIAGRMIANNINEFIEQQQSGLTVRSCLSDDVQAYNIAHIDILELRSQSARRRQAQREMFIQEIRDRERENINREQKKTFSMLLVNSEKIRYAKALNRQYHEHANRVCKLVSLHTNNLKKERQDYCDRIGRINTHIRTCAYNRYRVTSLGLVTNDYMVRLEKENTNHAKRLDIENSNHADWLERERINHEKRLEQISNGQSSTD